jgi:hypothetical protein
MTTIKENRAIDSIDLAAVTPVSTSTSENKFAAVFASIRAIRVARYDSSADTKPTLRNAAETATARSEPTDLETSNANQRDLVF